MPRTITGTARIRELDGTEILDLNDGSAYELVDWSDDEESWARLTTQAWNIDGFSPDHERLDGVVITVPVRCFGATWADVEANRVALKDAVAASEFLLEREIEGVSTTWRVCRPDTTAPISSSDIANRRRVVIMRFPAQPSPTITGV